MNVFERKNAELGKEFDRYVLEHPAFAAKLPCNAHIVLQVEGDEEFNEWARRVAEHNHETGQPLVYVTIKKLKPVRSRIAGLKLQQVSR